MTLEFNLPEEQIEADQAMNVGKLVSAIHDYNQKLRSLAKHSDDEVESERAEWARDLLYQELGVLTEIFEL